MNVKKIMLSVLVAMFSSQLAYGQDIIPLWVSDTWRSASYPSTEWYTGFARDKANDSPDKSKYEMIEKDAQNKLSESIVVQLQGTTTVESTSRQKQSGKNISETTNKNYRQEITSTSNAVLAKVETYSYFDKESGYIYGFATVKKKDLANFYRGNINTLFTFAEKEFAMAEQLAEQGKNKTALDKINVVEDSLKSVGYWSSFLQIVENDNSHTTKEAIFWQRVNSMKIRFENATSVYLDISGDNDLDKLSAEMQEKGCNCTIADKKESANYLIIIKTKLSRCNEESNGLFFCYANAAVIVENLKLKTPVNVKIPEAKGIGTKGNKDKAIEAAFKKLIDSLSEKINKTINQ
ncbi:MAG: hypothetical protein LBB36_04085 [Fibromonadaceae bacterium]|nr:hypothetical protein [Fibromonadaceae bacterium]